MSRRLSIAAFALISIAVTHAENRINLADDSGAPNKSRTAAASTLAEVDSALERFIAMVRAQDWHNARVMAGELTGRYEGTPRFDLYYSRVLLQQGRAQEAIFALERVLVASPDQHAIRLDLGRAYFINNNLERSKTEFERVLATKPPDTVRRDINNFLARISAAQRAQTLQLQMFAGLDIGYDTNINGGFTRVGTLAPNLLDLTALDEDSRATRGSSLRFRLGSTWVSPASLRAANLFSLQGHRTLVPGDSSYDQLGLNARWQYLNRSDRSRISVAINAGQFWLDTDPWQFSLSLVGEATFPVWGNLWLGPIATSRLSFSQATDRQNSVHDALGLVATVEDAPVSHRLSSRFEQFSRAGTDKGYSEWQGLSQRYQLGWQWPHRLTSMLMVQNQWRQYLADDRLFIAPGSSRGKQRFDQRLTIDASLTWLSRPWLTSRSGLRYEWHHSNINAYSQERWVVSQALTLTF